MYVYVTDYIVARISDKQNKTDSETDTSKKTNHIVFKDKEYSSILTSNIDKVTYVTPNEIIRHVIGLGINEFNAILNKYDIVFDFKDEMLDNRDYLKLIVKSKYEMDFTQGYDSLVMSIPNTSKLLIITPSLVKLLYSKLHSNLGFEFIGEVVKSPYKIFMYTVDIMEKVPMKYMDNIDIIYDVFGKYQETFRNLDRVFQLAIKDLKQRKIDDKFMNEVNNIYNIYRKMIRTTPTISELIIKIDLHTNNWKFKKNIKTGNTKAILIDPFVLFIENLEVYLDVQKNLHKELRKAKIF